MADDQYVLQCLIDKSSDGIKNFSRMLNCLDRFGKDLFFEFNEGEVRGLGGLAACHRTAPSRGATRAGGAADDQPGAVCLRQLHAECRLLSRLHAAAGAVGLDQAPPEEHGLHLPLCQRGGERVATACGGHRVLPPRAARVQERRDQDVRPQVRGGVRLHSSTAPAPNHLHVGRPWHTPPPPPPSPPHR